MKKDTINQKTVRTQELKKTAKSYSNLTLYGDGYFARIMGNTLVPGSIFPILMSIASLTSRLCCEISHKEINGSFFSNTLPWLPQEEEMFIIRDEIK